MRTLRSATLACCAIVLTACERTVPDREPGPAPDLTAHDAYDAALEDAGLAGTALVAQWREASQVSVTRPIVIDPPFREAILYPADAPMAVAYRVSLERGQALSAAIRVEPVDSAGVFLDIFRELPDGGLDLVASASEGSTWIEFEPRRGGTFVLRVQPELLRSVRVTLNVLRGATLAFPVLGGERRDIGSRFGADRDGGRRSHHGVDIFARRGTPVVAPTDARVSRVEETRLGGRVIWLRDSERRQSMYYAHLDRQLVEEGDRVQTGDTIGLVGNTGNARTTPPHLHFGIYARGEGPLDPFAFINPPPRVPPAVGSDSIWLGKRVRLRADARIDSRTAESHGSEPSGPIRLSRHTVFRIVGAHGNSVRALLPDGRMVIVRDPSLESLEQPIDQLVVRPGQPILSSPGGGALVVGEVEDVGELPVLGRYGSYRLIRPSPRLEGWVAGTP